MRATIALLVFAAACRKGPRDERELTSITVTPADLIEEVVLGTTASRPFFAEASYDDGTTAIVTSAVTWSIANPSLGSFSGSTLQIAPRVEVGVAGSVITAALDGVEGEAYFTAAFLSTSDVLFTVPFQQGSSFVVPLHARREESVDVFFLVDTTGSMGGEIANLQSALSSTIVPEVRAEIADSYFGVGSFEDFPVAPYGDPACSGGPDQPFTLRQAVTDSIAATQTGVNGLALGCGADVPESAIEALYQLSTAEGLSGPSPTNVPAFSAGFRPDAARIVMAISDAISHAPGEAGMCGTDVVAYAGTVAAVAHTRAQAKTALAQACTRVIGVASAGAPAGCGAEVDFTDFATTTGARVPPSAWDVPSRPAGCAATQCCTAQSGAGTAPDLDGLCPLVFRTDSSGAGLAAAVARAFSQVTRYAASDIDLVILGLTSSLAGVPLAGGASTGDFIASAVPSSFVAPAPPPALPDPTFDANGFYGVSPDTELIYSVAAFNDVAAGTNEPQLFRVRLQITGGCTTLDERDILFLVPRVP